MFKVNYSTSGISYHIVSYKFEQGQIVIVFKVKYSTSGTSGDILSYTSYFELYNIAYSSICYIYKGQMFIVFKVKYILYIRFIRIRSILHVTGFNSTT